MTKGMFFWLLVASAVAGFCISNDLDGIETAIRELAEAVREEGE